MKFVRTLENFIGNHIEGFFNKKFSSGVQPVELAKRIRRLMESERTVGVAHVVVPDQYTIFLTVQDFAKLEPSFSLIIAELRAFILEHARKKDYFLANKPVVEIRSDAALDRGTFQVIASYLKDLPAAEPAGKGTLADDLSGTRVFDRPLEDLKPAFSAPLQAELTVVEGSETGLAIDIHSKRINIGRRESNELSLNDVNISRLHAYILYEHGGHVVYDAKSLNGTYVNQHRISRRQLHNGDYIKLGNTIILYEVKKHGI